MCIPKEPHYFATDLPQYRIVRTEKDYLQLFGSATESKFAVGEASVWYLYSQEAINNIKIFNPDSKIIVMLRNPVELVYSMHAQHHYSADEDEAEFQTAWDLNNKRKNGLHIPKKCRDVKVLFYDEIAKLGEQVERLLDTFPNEQVKIIFSEDFFGNTSLIYKDVLQFLNIPDENREYFPKINANKLHKIAWLGMFTQRPPRNIVQVAMKLKRIMGIKYLGILKRIKKINVKEVQRKPLPSELRKQIISAYYADIIKLSRIMGRNLDHWLI